MKRKNIKARLSNKSLVGVIAIIGIVGIIEILSTFTTSVLAVETSGSVKLDTSVGESISMTITGNADGADCTNRGFDSCSTFGQMLPNSFMTTSSLISVYTNSSDGYSLSVRADSHTDLRADSNNSISAGTLTGETGGQGTWSYKTDNTGIKTSWTAMTTTDTTIKGTGGYSASGNDTLVTYGISTSDSQVSGTYSTTLIYTATAPNESGVVEPVTITGEHVTLSSSSLNIGVNGSGTVTVTPDSGYYLESFSCTNGYTDNATTGASATGAQTVTITNPGMVATSTCTAIARIPVTTTINLGAGIYGVQIKTDSLTGESLEVITTSGTTVTLGAGSNYYLIPLYQSGYTLDSITASGGMVTADANSYGYYYFTPMAGVTNEVTLTGTTLTAAVTDSSLTAMQGLSASNCPSIPTAVRDNRDDSVYYIQKLADGNCWMLENLRLDLVDNTVINSLTTSNTNVDSTSLNALKNGGREIASNYPITGLTGSQWTASHAYARPFLNSTYNTTTTTGYGPGRNYIGTYYNYCAASAGYFCPNNDTSAALVDSAIYDICPADWRMPTGGSSGEYQVLYMAYDRNGVSFRNTLSTLLAGYFYNGSVTEQDDYGYFWSSSRRDTYHTSYLIVESNSINANGASSIGRSGGRSTRCILK